MNLQEMSVAELEAMQTDLYNQAKLVSQKRKAVAAVLDLKRAEAGADAEIAGLSGAARRKIAQILGAKGIPSEEDVGTPGN